MRRSSLALLASLALAAHGAIACANAPVNLREPLPTHPDLVTGELPNGLSYILKQHANPPGRVSMQLHIDAGSLSETDRQRGIAHFLEHMAFNGSENFAPGELIPFFESIGLTFGRHQNAFTSLDQTVYILELPNTDADTISKGFAFLSDVLSGLLLLEDEIESEREVILEEKRRGLGPDQRVNEQVLPRITVGSRIADRLPIGVEETIRTMNRQDFVDFYTQWYTTGNTTLVVVGDFDPDTVRPIIVDRFAAIKAGDKPAEVDAGRVVYEKSFAVVATDPELRRCDVSMGRVEDPWGPITTVGQMRRSMISLLSSQIFNRRVQAKVAEGELSFRNGSATASDLFGAMRYISAQASGQPEDWREMLTDLITELQRARNFGFTDRELEDARRALLAQARQFSIVESTLPSRVITSIILQGVNNREPIMSAAQRFELMETLAPQITLEEINTFFRDTYTPDRVAFVLQMPSGDDVPTESEVLDAGLRALAAEVLADSEDERPDTLLDQLPEPGSVVEMAIHPDSRVFSAWLSNGVRMHHRFMDYRENQASITITLAGGVIEETADTRGLTRAASIALSRPATHRLSSTNIRDLLTGRTVSVGGGAGQDALSITVSGAPADLEYGMQVAHLLLSQPRIEQAAFDQWKQAEIQSIEARKQQPMRIIAEIIPDLIYPKDDPRMRPLEVDEVRALRLDDAQRWLDSLMRRAPIEVAVVGQIDRDQAVELVTRYLGSLPLRPQIHERYLEELRAVSKPEPPYTRSVAVPTRTPQAMVVTGFFGADSKNIRDTQLMRLASQIMSTRMIKRIREDEQLVYSIGAFHQPGATYPGFGMFMSAAPTEPAKAERLAVVIEEMFNEFAGSGPTDAEVTVAKGQIANQLDETMKEPGFWSGQLSDMTYRGVKLSEVVGAPQAYQAYSTSDIAGVFRTYFTPKSLLRVIVTPETQTE